VERKDKAFKVLKVNFYDEITNGFDLIKEFPAVRDDDARFVVNFRSVVMDPPPADAGHDVKNRYERKVAVYRCILNRAGFTPPDRITIHFNPAKAVRDAVNPNIDPSKGLTLDEATDWWIQLWKIYSARNEFRKSTKKQTPNDAEETREPQDTDDDPAQKADKEWADDDLKALLVMLTRCRKSGGSPDCAGYLALREISTRHTSRRQVPFEKDILDALRAGNIVIVDLSMGDEVLQKMFSKRISSYIFHDSMRRFTLAEPNNFIQFYFEEAHNLFRKEDDRESPVYSRIAKEGAKLNLGLVFATQELSSISGNILKNTQNWFVSHLNNEEEIRELRKYYDFSDFSDALIRFSQDTDKGFARMKSYSNAFVVPVQVDRFVPEKR
jgi:hypothetical protein